jgi:competence protein ComGF
LFQLMARLLHVQAFTCTIWFYNIIIINTNRNNGNREQPLEILGKS